MGIDHKIKRMKKILSFFLVLTVVGIFGCEKEYSVEDGGTSNNPNIIGADCRITKIVFTDTSSGAAKGSIAAIINSTDKVTDITKFDSLTATIDYNSIPVFIGDSLYINPDEYYILDAVTKRVKSFHGLIDPSNPFSPKFDASFTYDASGNLIGKIYAAPLINFGIPYLAIGYTYTGSNLTGMSEIDLTTGNLNSDASISYYPIIAPKNFMYLFPDEDTYAPYSQFLNFGNRPANAVQQLKLRYYNPGNIVRDSAISNFSSYTKSVDNYITSVIMTGSNQACIPALTGKLKFSYKCK